MVSDLAPSHSGEPCRVTSTAKSREIIIIFNIQRLYTTDKIDYTGNTGLQVPCKDITKAVPRPNLVHHNRLCDSAEIHPLIILSVLFCGNNIDYEAPVNPEDRSF